MPHTLAPHTPPANRHAARAAQYQPGNAATPRPIALAMVFTALIALALTLLGAGQAAARGAPESFADLAEELSPAVVNISTTQTVSGNQDFEAPQLPPGFPFEDQFREFFERGPGMSPRRVSSLGSGFIIDEKGVVVTNNHVIADADEIEVILTDGTSFEAEIVGRDSKTDIAVLRIDPKGTKLKAVPFGSSLDARVGDWVVAIGNPFGLGGTVTAGIISAMNRDIAAGPYDDFIQTDASINRGNSGGPLFNLDGQVIGVNTAIISPSGGSIGIGFSIPSEIAQNVIDQLLEFGETRRGWLGVRIQTVTDEIAETLGLDAARGALVAEVTEGSPADNAGIEPGDLIMTFDGKPIPEMRDLPRIVADTKIGKTVPVEVLRRGKKQTYDVKVERLDEAEQQAAVTDPSGSNDPAGSEVPALGLTLSELTPTLRKQYSLANEVSGVLITDIQTDSPARGTLRTGDVIVEVAQQGVKTPTQVRDQIKTQTDDKKSVVLFLINRGGDLTFLTVRLENS